MKDGNEAETLLETIEAELKVHTTIEEEIFYPAFREAATRKDDTKLYYEAVEEHHVVDMVLPEMDKGEAGSPEFAAKAKVLKDLVEHHAGEEEKEMFPRARKLMDKDELKPLGEQLARRKQGAEGGGRRARGRRAARTRKTERARRDEAGVGRRSARPWPCSRPPPPPRSR